MMGDQSMEYIIQALRRLEDEVEYVRNQNHLIELEVLKLKDDLKIRDDERKSFEKNVLELLVDSPKAGNEDRIFCNIPFKHSTKDDYENMMKDKLKSDLKKKVENDEFKCTLLKCSIAETYDERMKNDVQIEVESNVEIVEFKFKEKLNTIVCEKKNYRWSSSLNNQMVRECLNDTSSNKRQKSEFKLCNTLELSKTSHKTKHCKNFNSIVQVLFKICCHIIRVEVVKVESVEKTCLC